MPSPRWARRRLAKAPSSAPRASRSWRRSRSSGPSSTSSWASLGIFGFVIVVFGVLTLFFAVALLSGRNWARILILIGAVLDIISIVGIIWGAILLYYFTRRHVVAYFKAPK